MKLKLQEINGRVKMDLFPARLKERSWDLFKGYKYLPLILIFVLFGNFTSKAQVVINEILPPGRVELKNIGSDTVNIADYWLCNFPSYQSLSTFTLQCGNTLLVPGQILTVTDFNNFDQFDGEMGLYANSSFSSPGAILDYVEWGSTGHQRSSVAIAAGIWSTGDFVPAFGAGMSIEYDASGDASSNWDATASPTICTENSNIPLICDVESGIISTTDATSICVDGIPDPIDVDVSGSPTGSLGAWIITDDQNNILALPNTPPFDLDGAGVGTCIIWYVRYDTGFEGNVVGNNLADLTGCFDISNGITVSREGPDGGTITLLDGSTSYAQCAGNIVFDVTHTTASPNLSYWYIITDDSNNILAFQNSTAGSTLDLSAAPAGTCRVWGWSYRGLADPIVGDPISTLTDDDCEAISDDFITVNREVADGGTITLADGSTSYTQCAGNIVFEVVHTTTAANLSYWYIITDDSNNILAFQNSTAGSTLDLSAAPAGTCRVWGWNYSGLPDPIVGDPISTLMDDDCEAISAEFITVNREVPDGGVVTLADGSTTFTGVAGDIMVDVIHTTTAANLSYWYIITDDNNNILAFQNSTVGSTLDLSGAPAGTCRIWGWNYLGLADPVVGDPISTLMDDACEDVSDDFITVERTLPVVDGGIISTTDDTTTCIDGNPDPINVTVTGAMGTNDGWIITDVDNNILALPPTSTFDLEGAGVGVCILWHIRYEDGLTGLTTANNLSDLTGNFDLSNGITVTREIADGGVVTFADGSTEFTGVAGDIMVEVIHTTTATNLDYTYVITDDDANILAFQSASAGGMLDLSGAPVGTCRIWGWSHSGVGDPVVGDPISSLTNDACEAVSPAYLSVIRNAPVVDAGIISTTDDTSICVDGNPDPINVTVMGVPSGTLDGWIITDDSNNILALPNASPFDLDGAGVGTCIIWYVRYEDGFTGNEVGNNLSDLTGNFDLSNGITVTREVPDGGSVMLLDGSTSYAACAGDIVFDISHTTTAANLSYWYVITDDNDNILAFENATAGGNLDLSAAPAGTCRVWGWSYSGEPTPIVGDPISTLADGDCEAISAEFITVYREVPDGGTVDSDLGTDIEICIDGEPDPIMVSHITTAQNISYWYIITDDSDNILDWTTESVIDLEGAGVGTCRIWGWNYRGLADPVMGDPITSLTDDDCEDISDNFITVVRVDEGVNCVVSISEIDAVDQLNIYPNPASDFLQVEYEGLTNGIGQLALVDLLGRSFLKKDLGQVNDAFSLNISEVPFGVYMIRIDSGSFTTVKRIVIMK